MRGILVTQNFSTKIVSPEDLSTYTQLRVGSVSSKLHVPFAGQVATLRLFLNEMFSGVTETEEEEGGIDGANVTTFGLHEDQVKVATGKTRGVATVSWDASPAGDILADAVVALLMHAQSSIASIRLTSQPCGHRRKKTPEDDDEPASKKQKEEEEESPANVIESRLRLIHNTLLEQFDNVEATYEGSTASFEIQTDTGLEKYPADGGILTCTVKIEFEDESNGIEAKVTVECEDATLAGNLQECVKNVALSSAPIKL